LRNKPLLILAAALACFHLGNGAMLPLYGLAVVGMGKGDPAMFTATTVMVAQAVMIVASLAAMKLADRRGYWLVLLISFAALPFAACWPARSSNIGACLAGPGAGWHRRRPAKRGRARPDRLPARWHRAGHVGQGAVMTVQGWAPALPRDRRLAGADAGYHATF
jgi:hypothetical protein